MPEQLFKYDFNVSVLFNVADVEWPRQGKVAKGFNTVIWWHICICIYIDMGLTPAPKELTITRLLNRPKTCVTLAK